MLMMKIILICFLFCNPFLGFVLFLSLSIIVPVLVFPVSFCFLFFSCTLSHNSNDKLYKVQKNSKDKI